MSWSLLKTLVFLSTFVAVCGLALWLAQSPARDGQSPWREAASIILFIPLIWSFLRLRPPGMVLAGAILAGVRVGVERLQLRATSLGEAVQESVFPLALYAAMGILFHIHRRRQAALVERLVLASSLETRQQMASRLAHDFNNVLTIISGTAQLMQAQIHPNTQGAGDVKAILDASEQGMHLVREMINVSHELPPRKVACDLSKVVAHQMKMVGRILPSSVQVSQELCPEPLSVLADSGRLLRVLTNLCLNASNAMPQGGRLTVRTSLSPGPSPAYAILEVQDTGCGIALRNMRKLFTPFFTTRRASGGTGLGLSIVKSIVDEHGWKIGVASPPGQGACFWIHLPLIQTPISPPIRSGSGLANEHHESILPTG